MAHLRCGPESTSVGDCGTLTLGASHLDLSRAAGEVFKIMLTLRTAFASSILMPYALKDRHVTHRQWPLLLWLDADAAAQRNGQPLKLTRCRTPR